MRTASCSSHTSSARPEGVTVHQPSIRAHRVAHDVVFDRRRFSDRRGWAPQSVGRSLWTINHPGNARTGTVAVGSRRSRWPCDLDLPGSGHGGSAARAALAELGVIDLVAQHDIETNEQPPSQGNFGLGAPATMEHGEVHALEVAIRPRREGSRLAEDPSEQRAALLTDAAEAVLVCGGVDGRRQADVANHVLAVWEALHGAEDEHGGECG